MNEQQILTCGTIVCRSILNKCVTVDYEVERKADPDVWNIIVRYLFHLVPLPFPCFGLLEGAVVTCWHLFVQQQQQQRYY